MPAQPTIPIKNAGVLRILKASSTPNFDEGYAPIKHKVEGRYLLANQDLFYVQALVQITNVQEFPPDFINALALKFAALLAPQAVGSMEVTAALHNMYKAQLQRAETADSQQGSAEQITMNTGPVGGETLFGTKPFSGW